MINKVILVGNVGGDPEVRSFPNGGRVANFSLATSDSWKDDSGNLQERTEWHRISIYRDGLIDVVEKYIKKGAKLYIEGSIRTRKYTDSNGVEKYSTEISMRNAAHVLKMLDTKGGSRDTGFQGSDNAAASAASNESDNVKGSASANNSEPSSGTDDDIPF